MISQHTIQQIQNRIDIVEIVGDFVKLKKRGANYLGLCPFHNEKTPSFTVSPAKEIFKCFGCGKSGNTIGFIMELEKYSYTEALRWLAGKYNIEVEETEVSPELKALQQTADSLYIVNNFAGNYFRDQLFTSEEGQGIGLSYLKERGFREETIKKFQLGYCPEKRDAFAQAALAAKYNPEYLLKTGLVVKRDDHLIDNYRGRIIFPVHNTTGKVIGFGARVIGKNDKGPKYINTPENEIYVKSRILYGSYFARQAIDKNDECYLVEGYTDVISLHQSGIENVVASGGTSLTSDQLRLIRKYTRNLTILYDGDTAGIKAALRGMDMALEEGLNVKVVLIPDGEDPDSYVNKTGSTGFINFIQKEKKDVILFQLEVSLKETVNDPVKKAAVVNQIAETISRINKVEDFTRQQDYIKRCSELLQIAESGLHALVNKFIREKVNKEGQKAAVIGSEAETPGKEAQQPEINQGLDLVNPDEMQERALLRCLIELGNKPWDQQKKVAEHLFEEVENEDIFDNPQLQQIFRLYKQWYENGLEPGPKNFLYHEDQKISGLVLSLLDFPYEISPNWQEQYEMKVPSRDETYRDDILSTLTYLKLRKVKKLIEENQRDLEKPHTSEEQLVLLHTHRHLKEIETGLLNRVGTVIFR